MAETVAALRQRARRVLESRRDAVLALSHGLHAEPELSWEEHRSAGKICDLLERSGFQVEHGVADLPTAFKARRGQGDLVLGICAEYDALPDIGHACGHNVNGASAVAAALALGEIADDIGITVALLGTPAEEAGGGKVYLLEAGVFDDIAAAMMVHASPTDLAGMTALAITGWQVTYTGRAAHAAAMPHRGVNAADAMVIAQVAINAYRQQMIPGAVVSGVVTRGGETSNVIPQLVTANYECRAATAEELGEVTDRVRRCFEAGALATGAELDITTIGKDFAELRQDEHMTALYREAAESLGREFAPTDRKPGSTDMGNISQVMPTIHPMIGYECGDAAIHSPEFTRYGTSPGADRAVLDGGLAMAWTGLGLALDDGQRERLLAGVRNRRARADGSA